MVDVKEIQKFVKKRPKVIAVYGYGSGIFKQSSYTTNYKPQIDLIFVVENLKDWHLKNMMINSSDYSFTGKLYFKHASLKKLKGSTGITYLSNINYKNSTYKYGTIEEKDLILYLQNWKSFYLPGRFQKNILAITNSKLIDEANEKNRNFAVLAALLTLPDNNNNKLFDLYVQICSLSYLGDTRMKFAENPRKVINIVEGDYEFLNKTYGKSDYVSVNDDTSLLVDYQELIKSVDLLPLELANYLNSSNCCNLASIKSKILEYFTKLNKKESTEQTIKGIFTNGPIRSTKYAFAKIMKKFKH